MHRTLALAATIVCAAISSLDAQTKLFVLSQQSLNTCAPTDCPPGSVVEIDVDNRRLVANTFALHVGHPGITADGRYILWSASEPGPAAIPYFVVFDTVSRVQQDTPYSRSRVFTHPSAIRAFLHRASNIVVAQPGGLGEIPIQCEVATLIAVTGDARRAAFVCVPGGDLARVETAVFDVATGARVGRVAGIPASQTLNVTGTELYTVTSGFGQSPPLYRRYDIATGVLIVERRVGTDADGVDHLTIDPRTGHVYASLNVGTQVLNGETLESIARITATLPIPAVARIAFDPDAPRAYFAWHNTNLLQTRLSIVDTDRHIILMEGDLPIRTRPIAVLLSPRPPQPTGLTHSVTGSRVTLQWSAGARGIATEYILEAGSVPGSANLASLRLPGSTQTFTVANVPPGTYFIRVRAVNYTGVSAPSNEMRLLVQ